MYLLNVYPARSLDGVLSRPTFYYDTDGELQLEIEWKDKAGTTEKNLVQSLDGKSVYDFFLDMANAPIPNPQPNVGSRMQFLLTFMLRHVENSYGTWSQGLAWNDWMSSIFNVYPR